MENGRGPEILLVPPSALRWIALHRTSLAGHPDVGASYSRMLLEESRELEPFLPSRARRILDIGCGMAGIDVFLSRRLRPQVVHLMDGDGIGPVRVGFHDRIDVYSSREAARELLELNGVRGIRFHDPDPDRTIPSDLILSLLSCGHHYPLGTYSGLVSRSLASGGRAIFDIRKGTAGRLPGCREVGRINKGKSVRTIFERE